MVEDSRGGKGNDINCRVVLYAGGDELGMVCGERGVWDGRGGMGGGGGEGGGCGGMGGVTKPKLYFVSRCT